MKKADLYLLGVTIIWGSTFPLMKISLSNVYPIAFLAIRLGIAIFPIIALVIIKKERVLRAKDVYIGMLLALALFAGHALQIYGLEITSATNSAFITSLYVVFVPLISFWMLNEKLRTENFISLLVALLGLYLLTGLEKINVGDILTALCAIAFSFQIVMVQKYSKENYISLTFWQTLWSFIFTLITLALIKKTGSIYVRDILILLYLGIFGSFLGFIIQMRYQREVKASRAAIIYALEPAFGAIFSFLILSETLSLLNYVGALLIFIAVWLDTKTLKI